MVSFSKSLPEIFSLAKDEITGEDILYPTKETPCATNVLVENFESASTLEDLKILFEIVGPVVEIVQIDKNSVMITMESMKDANTAVKSYHGQKLDEKILKCTVQSGKV